jgi:hypothetical protein
MCPKSYKRIQYPVQYFLSLLNNNLPAIWPRLVIIILNSAGINQVKKLVLLTREKVKFTLEEALKA